MLSTIVSPPRFVAPNHYSTISPTHNTQYRLYLYSLLQELTDDQLFQIFCRYYTPSPHQTPTHAQLLDQCMFIIDQYYSQDLEQLLQQMRQRRSVQPNIQRTPPRLVYQMAQQSMSQRQSVPFVHQSNNRFYSSPQQFSQHLNSSQIPIQEQCSRHSQLPSQQQSSALSSSIHPHTHSCPVMQQLPRQVSTHQPCLTVNQSIQPPTHFVQTPVIVSPIVQAPLIPALLPPSSSSSLLNSISVIADHKIHSPPPLSIVHKILPFYTLICCIYSNGDFKFDKNKNLNRCHLKFRLDLESCNLIAESYDYEEDLDQFKTRYCLILRLARTDQQPINSHLGHDDNLPPNLIVSLNSQNVPLPLPKPCRQNTDLIRNGREIDITQQAMLSPLQINSLVMTWQLLQELEHYKTAKYVVCIYLMKRQYVSDLVREVIYKRKKLEKSDLRQIYAQLNGADSDLCVSDYKVMLKCPINQCRLKLPARAATCQHLQCFDLTNYIAMNEKSSKWLCPVCSRPALYDQIRLDHYTETILSSTNDSTTEIKFDSDLNWSPVLIADHEHQISSTASNVMKSCIMLDEEEEEDSKTQMNINHTHLQENIETDNEIILLDN